METSIKKSVKYLVYASIAIVAGILTFLGVDGYQVAQNDAEGNDAGGVVTDVAKADTPHYRQTSYYGQGGYYSQGWYPNRNGDGRGGASDSNDGSTDGH